MSFKSIASKLFEFVRFAGTSLLFYLTYKYLNDNVSRLHFLSFGAALILSGTTAIEGIFWGKESAEKIGYKEDKQYQIQSALFQLAIVIASTIVFFAKWGKFADATIAIVMLLFFILSGINHTASAIIHKNYKVVNILRLIFSLIILIAFLPSIIGAIYFS